MEDIPGQTLSATVHSIEFRVSRKEMGGVPVLCVQAKHPEGYIEKTCDLHVDGLPDIFKSTGSGEHDQSEISLQTSESVDLKKQAAYLFFGGIGAVIPYGSNPRAA